ncbi:uncharacterized protein TNCV_2585631 [Trichonephila clavipes]|nr:uncharacterized protein TNCV_2585631 [Trichonephila clavipes]
MLAPVRQRVLIKPHVAQPVQWLATLTAVPWGLGSNPGEDTDVCKCIVPARDGGTLNSRRAASLLVRLVEGEERWESSDHPQSVLPLNWGGIDPNRTVACMVLKATANDRRDEFCHDEFRGPRYDLCRSGGIGNNNNIFNIVKKVQLRFN